MYEKIEEKMKAIQTLLIVLIVTTAATAGLVAVVMIQWAPVASYYKELIAEEAAYEAEYGTEDEDAFVDESGELEEDVTLTDENGNPITEEEDVVITDADGNPVEDEGVVDDTSSEDAAQ